MQQQERVHQSKVPEMFLPQGYFLIQIAKTVINKISFPSLIIPLENDETTFGQIVSLYIQRAKITTEMLGNASLHLAIPKVGDISDDDTIYEIKCRLHNYSLNHLALQLILKQNSFTYQCFQYYHFEEHEAYKNSLHSQNLFQIFIKIPQFSIGVYRMLNCESTIEEEIIKLLKQSNNQTEQVFKNIKPIIECQGCSQSLDYRGKINKVLKQHPTILICFNDIKIQKQIKETHINKPIIVDIFESVGVKIGTFQYHSILDHKVYTLLHLCKVPNSKKKGLKIGSKLLKPNQFMTQLMISTTDNVESYSCYVVTECQMFYCSLPAKVPTFDIKEYSHILGNDIVTVEEKRNSQILQTTNQHYKQVSFIDPILIYTSNKAYKQLNEFLRCYYFCLEHQYSQLKQYWQWKKFTHSLINSLQKMPNFSGIVYRGSNYRDYIFDKIGKKQFFKTFVSSSICQNQARSFTQGNGTLFIIECLTGKNISSFSYYKKQNEVLFYPYTYFQVTDIDDSNPQLKKVYLREIPALHQRNSNVLLWVDDRIEEGINLYNQYKLKYPRIKTELIQLLSNKHFQLWVKMFGYLLIGNQQISAAGEQISKKTTLITDMARGELFQEGVETINIARRYLPDIDILVYIGNLQRARQTLLRHNLQINDRLQVTNSPTILKQFLATRVFSPAELQTSCQLI